MILLDVPLWILCSIVIFGIPGFLASFAVKDLDILERVAASFGFGLVITAGVALLISFIMPYSFTSALIMLAISYIIGLVIVFKFKENLSLKWSYASIAVLILFIANFAMRAGSYSAIFAELDPYFYLYSSTLLLKHGEMPLNDFSAWQPHYTTTRRGFEFYTYPNTLLYSLYTLGGEYNTYLLSLIASLTPPLYAALSAFFIYYMLSRLLKDSWIALGSTIVLSFTPIFVMKLLAGEFEVQPYAFFSLAAFLAFYTKAMFEKDRTASYITAIFLAAVFLGTNSDIIVFAFSTAIMLSLVAYNTYYEKKALDYVKLSLPSFAMLFLCNIYTSIAVLPGSFPEYVVGGFFALCVAAILLLLNKEINVSLGELNNYIDEFRKSKTHSLAALALILFYIVMFTPIGEFFLKPFLSGFFAASFRIPLDKTIQEQGVAGASFEGQLGFLGASEKESPFLIVLSPFSMIFNTVFSFLFQLINNAYHLQAIYIPKTSHLLLAIHVLFVAFAVYKIIKKSEPELALAFLIIIEPISLVGIVKAKYTIYLGFFTCIALAYVIREFIEMLKSSRYELVPYAFMLLLAAAQVFSVSPIGFALLYDSPSPKFSDNPSLFKARFAEYCATYGDQTLCEIAEDPVAFANKGPTYHYNADICKLSLLDPKENSTGYFSELKRISASLRCSALGYYWVDSMEWLKNNTEENATIISWWDYGHWENYFAERRAVIRNDQAHPEMIYEVAYYFIHTPESELIEYMKEHQSRYLLLDQEIIIGGRSFGGKYGALNYLGCAHTNGTNVSFDPGQSDCEREHTWEVVYIPKSNQQSCDVSAELKGVVAYTVAKGAMAPTYCLSTTTLITGQKINALYYLGKYASDGSLKIHKGFLAPYAEDSSMVAYATYFTKDLVWYDDGEIKSGWEDRKGKFYDSVIYKGFVLEELDGFEQVYKTPGGEVKIYRIKG
ncbi:MAG: hypothetical protein QW035_02635 [Candidatus Anstonellales archaeon]